MSQTIDVKRYEELARQKQGEHRKFLAQLKKKAPKNLDKIVQQVHNEVFRRLIVSSVLIAVRRLVLTLQSRTLLALPSIFA